MIQVTEDQLNSIFRLADHTVMALNVSVNIIEKMVQDNPDFKKRYCSELSDLMAKVKNCMYHYKTVEKLAK